MAHEHLAAVLEHARKGGSHLMILMVIAYYCDTRGEWIVDLATLQKRTRFRRRRVQQLLDELVKAGELAVTRGDGRGKLSKLCLLIGPGPEKGAEECTLSAQKGAEECILSEEKGAEECTLSAQKGAEECTLSHPPVPPFPPDPPIPPYPPEAKTKNQETFGLRPLSGPQSGVFRVNLLLDEAGIPRPSPAQINLWSSTLGGIEPLLALLGRLIHAGLATKREPHRYIHRVVMEQAARPEPLRPARSANPMRTAGADELRRQQAARIMAGKKGHT